MTTKKTPCRGNNEDGLMSGLRLGANFLGPEPIVNLWSEMGFFL